MSETIAATQPQEGVTGEGSAQADIALAKALHEQEQAWLHLLQNPSNVSASIGDESLATRETGSSETEQNLADEDWAFAVEMQQLEYREHAMRLAAAQQEEHGNVDVDSMTYEDLSLLGDTVGTVQIGLSTSCKQKLQQCTYTEACSDGSAECESTCTICQHDYAPEEQVCKLPCKHLFHTDCIDRWFTSSKTCPVCMCEVEKSN